MGSVEICFCQRLSPNGTTYCDGFLPCTSPVATLLTSGQDAACMFHQPRQNWRVVTECFLCWHVMIPLVSVSVFLMIPFDCLSPFEICSAATSALHIFATQFLNAMIAGSASLFNEVPQITWKIDESRHSLNCQWSSTFFNATLLMMLCFPTAFTAVRVVASCDMVRAVTT